MIRHRATGAEPVLIQSVDFLLHIIIRHTAFDKHLSTDPLFVHVVTCSSVVDSESEHKNQNTSSVRCRQAKIVCILARAHDKACMIDRIAAVYTYLHTTTVPLVRAPKSSNESDDTAVSWESPRHRPNSNASWLRQWKSPSRTRRLSHRPTPNHTRNIS